MCIRMHGEYFVAKNKLAPPYTEAEFELRCGVGVDTVSELIDLGLADCVTLPPGMLQSTWGGPFNAGFNPSPPFPLPVPQTGFPSSLRTGLVGFRCARAP
jgi:hypothetical protein